MLSCKVQSVSHAGVRLSYVAWGHSWMVTSIYKKSIHMADSRILSATQGTKSKSKATLRNRRRDLNGKMTCNPFLWISTLNCKREKPRTSQQGPTQIIHTFQYYIRQCSISQYCNCAHLIIFCTVLQTLWPTLLCLVYTHIHIFTFTYFILHRYVKTVHQNPPCLRIMRNALNRNNFASAILSCYVLLRIALRILYQKQLCSSYFVD